MSSSGGPAPSSASAFLRAFVDSPMAEAVTKTAVCSRQQEQEQQDTASAPDAAGAAVACSPPAAQRSASATAAAAFVRAVDRPFFLLH
jgi:hypothetical protein